MIILIHSTVKEKIRKDYLKKLITTILVEKFREGFSIPMAVSRIGQNLFIMKKIFCLLIFTIFLSCSKSDQKNNITTPCKNYVTFGDTKICLPEVDGMTECYGIPIVKTLVDTFNYKGNTTLAFYLNNETYKEVEQLDKIAYDKYCKIFVNDKLKFTQINIAEFNELASSYEDAFQKQNWNEIRKEFEKKHEYKSIGKPVLIESYQSHKKVRTFVLIGKVQTNDYENVLVSTANMLLIHDRLINMSYFQDYDGEESIKKAKAKNDYIVFLLLDENK